MGRPKPLLPFPERPLLAVLAERFASVFPELRIVCASAAMTPDLEITLSDYRLTELVLFDDRTDGGPLAGVERAARHARRLGATRWLVVPCDMPFLTAAFLERLAAAFPDAPAAAPCSADGRVSGVCAAYGPAVQPALSNFLGSGRRRVQDFLALVGAARFAFPAYADLPAADRLLCNLNTPEDYQQALASLSNNNSTSVPVVSNARQSGVKKPSSTARSRNANKPS